MVINGKYMKQNIIAMKPMCMIRQFLVVAALILVLPVSAKTPSAASETERVEAVICQVNDYWQQHHSYKTPSFWNWAAYHTGN